MYGRDYMERKARESREEFYNQSHVSSGPLGGQFTEGSDGPGRKGESGSEDLGKPGIESDIATIAKEIAAKREKEGKKPLAESSLRVYASKEAKKRKLGQQAASTESKTTTSEVKAKAPSTRSAQIDSDIAKINAFRKEAGLGPAKSRRVDREMEILKYEISPEGKADAARRAGVKKEIDENEAIGKKLKAEGKSTAEIKDAQRANSGLDPAYGTVDRNMSQEDQKYAKQKIFRDSLRNSGKSEAEIEVAVADYQKRQDASVVKGQYEVNVNVGPGPESREDYLKRINSTRSSAPEEPAKIGFLKRILLPKGLEKAQEAAETKIRTGVQSGEIKKTWYGGRHITPEMQQKQAQEAADNARKISEKQVKAAKAAKAKEKSLGVTEGLVTGIGIGLVKGLTSKPKGKGNYHVVGGKRKEVVWSAEEKVAMAAAALYEKLKED